MRSGKLIYIPIMFLGVMFCTDKTEIVEKPHDLLNSVLWMQHAAEYKASCYHTYNTARAMLIAGLNDSKWTAATEQGERYEHLPPAIILDVDETVLDNSSYEASLIMENSLYSTDSWKKWCEERRAKAVTGAVDFCKFADENDVRVLYVTNRRQSEFNATRDNLIAAGFPSPIDSNTLHMRTDQSDKTARRQMLAEKYRIILLIGDNCGDFHGGYTKAESALRDSLVHAHQSFWGSKWIVLTNPSYGDWEGALFDYNYKLTESQKRVMKKKKLML